MPKKAGMEAYELMYSFKLQDQYSKIECIIFPKTAESCMRSSLLRMILSL